MKDIPVFNTEFGVASLFLREIPYRQRAHIKIQSSLEPERLLAECVDFCRACGAEWIDGAGHEYLEKYPLITVLYTMQCDRSAIGETDACLFPVTEKTVQQWLDIYNEKMADVPNAAFMDSRDGKELLQTGDGYFVHRDGQLLGIGKAAGDFIDTVIAVKPGMGETVVKALSGILVGDTVRLMVAGANERAVRLYERMGFVKVREVSRWYRVL
ncbi:MAG: GNAT family N-acetyltransferase [Oscillospiraceae bacterium]|nr:GNAT family N-acetyltransferase [Oscillospiraceae bacterium]